MKLTAEQLAQIKRMQLERQRECDHSFNDNNECEYCGLSEDSYSQSCCDGDSIGTYQ